MKIHGDTNSGNCLKVKYTAEFLGQSYDWIDVDIMSGQSRTPAFLALNAFGQVPVLELDDGRTLAQSNAIILHLARGSSLIPGDAFEQSKVHEWLFWEQYSHEPSIAVSRFQVVYLKKSAVDIDPQLLDRGNKALDFMDAALTHRAYLVGDRLSLADICLIAYTRLAHEGGFDLTSRPAVRQWINQVETDLSL